MTDHDKLYSLRRRLIAEQRQQIDLAASGEALPSNNLTRYITDLESTILAVENSIEDEER